jgi:hypothetical protein
MAQGKSNILGILQDNQRRIVSGLLVVGGIYLTYRLGNRLVAQWSKRQTQTLADDSPEVRQAMTLQSAMNPSGVRWMRSFDTTNTRKVLETGRLITNLDAVQSAYQKLYQSNLLDDLQSELSTEDYQKFITLVSSNSQKVTTPGGSAPVQFAKPQSLVVAKKEVFLRSSPDATNHGAIYEQFSPRNILRTAKAGEFLGYATGRQHFDERNNVKFIEVAYVINGAKAPANLKSKNKQRVSFWVSSSATYVELFTYFKPMFDTYPGTVSLTAWMKPVDFFTIKGIAAPRLLTIATTPILDEYRQTINQAQPNTVLGRFIMSIDTGEDVYLQFQTVDNQLRWVNQKTIALQEES